MTGMEFYEIDDTVKDGIGEICNMLAGAWKGRCRSWPPTAVSPFRRSLPAAITTCTCRRRSSNCNHFYAFQGRQFDVTIVCDGLQ